MSLNEARKKDRRIQQLRGEMSRLRGSDSTSIDPVVFWVPGRIEVLGKHTDYGGGRSLLCAVERGFCVLTLPRDAGDTHAGKLSPQLVRVLDADTSDTAEFEISPDVVARPGHWSNYAITVARRIATNFDVPVHGADIAFTSDLPPAAGVSSSSALVVATFLALSAVNHLEQTSKYRANIHSLEDLGGYLGAVENGLDFRELHGRVGVGTFGGSEDQTAILCSRPNSVTQYSFSPVTFERAIALPDGYCFAIGSSGVRAEKTGAALELYNGVSRRLSAGLDVWRNATGRSDHSMQAAIASSADAPDRIREVLSTAANTEYPAESLLERFEQFNTEVNEIIPAAGDALARGDLASFGDLVARSQRGAERALGNQIPETVTLVRRAREFGAVAASAFGAGFGGSVWALVQTSSLDTFIKRWSEAYVNEFPQHAQQSDFFGTRAGPPAMKL